MRIWLIIVLLAVTFSSCKDNRRAIVISKVRAAAKLATTETTIDKVIFGTKEKKLLLFIGLKSAKFAATSRAYIKSGIDLNKIRPEDIKTTDNRIEIELPHVEVINFDYPFKEFKIDHAITDNTFFTKIDIEDQEHFYRLGELDIRNHLQYTGIKQATEEKTRRLIEGILKNLGYEEIYIRFKEKGELMPEVNLKEEEID